MYEFISKKMSIKCKFDKNDYSGMLVIYWAHKLIDFETIYIII